MKKNQRFNPYRDQNQFQRGDKRFANRNFQNNRRELPEADRNFQYNRRNLPEASRNFQNNRRELPETRYQYNPNEMSSFRRFPRQRGTRKWNDSDRIQKVHNVAHIQKPKDKVEEFVDLIIAQKMGGLVLVLIDGQHPFVSLQNSLMLLPSNPIIQIINEKDDYTLLIDKEEYAKGTFVNKKETKIALAWQAIDKLHKTCFTLIKKKPFVEVLTEELKPDGLKASCSSEQKLRETVPESPHVGSIAQKMMLNMGWSGGGLGLSSKSEQSCSTESEPSLEDKKSENSALANPHLAGSIAHKMMLKMGWCGGGLGLNEQGIEESIEVKENVNRNGLGHANITNEIRKILTDLSRSNKITTLAFSKDFTKDERQVIHQFCLKMKNLKSKSYGKGEDRFITVSRKVSPMDIVKQLLRTECENEHFKLVVPENYQDKYLELLC